jgi:hypothetical protein
VREKITIRNGRVLESNYTGYEVTRMSDVSNIEIKVVSANDVPLGRRRVVDITQVADRLSERLAEAVTHGRRGIDPATPRSGG